MAKKQQKEKSIEETLWDSANKLRGSVEPSEYKHVVLSLIFLKYAYDHFVERRNELIADGKESFVEQAVFYNAKNVFYLNEISRWDYLIENAKQNDIAIKIDAALAQVEKKDSIKTLLLTLWKSEDDKVTKTESGELGSAVSAYIERIRADRSIVPSFNTFYEYMRDDYRRELAERDIKVEKEDFNIDNMLTTMRQYYRGGRYDFLLNSAENIDLLGKRFIVFEIDSIKDNRELFPVVTIIIMEAFINKMRRLKGVRKQLIVEEAWKALSSANMADYLRYMYKTVRKYFGEAIVVTQEVDDIISSPVVKESIINNSDCKILLDQRKYMNKFDQIQALLGLTEKEKSQILSINMANNPSRLYKEVWIGLGGTQSAVYATEVSAEEYLAYTTEETEKVEVYRLAEQLGGDIEAAIRQLAERRRNKK